MKTSLRAAIFDMDGVLTATVDYHYRSWKIAVRGYGIPFTRQDNEKLLGLTRSRSLDVLLGDTILSNEQKQDILDRKNRAFTEYINLMGPADLQPGVTRLIKELHQAGIRTAVASASRNARPILERLGILGYFDAIIDGNIILHSKPSPEAFLKAATALGVSPEDCIVIEDSESGIAAARSAGMCVVGLGPVERVRHANAIFQNLAGVRLEDLLAVHR